MTDLLFRADGGPGIGAGHLMRCLSLAQRAAERGWRGHLAVSRPTGLPAGWTRLGGTVHVLGRPSGSDADLDDTVALARWLGAAWVVADHYAFDAGFLDRLAAGAGPLLYLDDLGERDAAADIVVNPNPGAESRCRDRHPRARRLLLGADYFLLRDAVARLRPEPEPGRVLISFGADDDANLALDFVAGALAAGMALNADVVCTAPGDGLERLRLAVAEAPGQWRIHAGPLEIAPLMARAAVCVCAGGGTAGEAASLGIPAVIVVRADNQAPGARALAERGAARLAGEGAGALPAALAALAGILADGPLRDRMAGAGRRLIDGGGAGRVIQAMQEMGRGK